MHSEAQNGQAVIITGGTRGVGAGIARQFYDRGARVLLGARKDNGEAARLGERARFRKMDVRGLADHRAIIEEMIEWAGRLDVYVNCAGFSQWKPISEADDSFWNEMLDTNLKGTFWGCKAAAERMERSGCIVNVSSLAGKRGSANNSVYCASKFGVNGLTQALAKELGPRGIRVNAVCPVYVNTDGLATALGDERSPCAGGEIERFLQDFARENAALGSIPTAEQVGDAVVYLASEAASAITGQCINVDCGVLPQ